ncbi:MAG: SAM-dependent methyltransferase, partial [Eubacteriales bacterium]
MRISTDWKDYELLDCSDGERLERWGDIILIRPDPQVIWKTEKNHPLWRNAHAHYQRSLTGGGAWDLKKKVPDSWSISYRDLTFNLKTMGFKHTGVFPEQAVNWDLLSETVKLAGRPVKVLNLFAYTGAATVACLKAG